MPLSLWLMDHQCYLHPTLFLCHLWPTPHIQGTYPIETHLFEVPRVVKWEDQ